LSPYHNIEIYGFTVTEALIEVKISEIRRLVGQCLQIADEIAELQKIAEKAGGNGYISKSLIESMNRLG